MHTSFSSCVIGTPTAAPAGEQCLKDAAAERPRACFNSFTKGQALSESSRLMYPGAPLSTLKGSGPSLLNAAELNDFVVSIPLLEMGLES